MSQPNPVYSKYVLAICRALEPEENKILGNNFKNIVVYNSELHSNTFDLSKMSFDLLIIDVSSKDNHQFLEVIAPMCPSQRVAVVFLKKKFSNYDELVEALDAFEISKVADLTGPNFMNFLVKKKLPKLNNRCFHLFKKVAKLVIKQ